ncbi:hypothetical protein [Streptomyces sp. GS7]|uniref:hypothetical protein n=1 Tax=Streptomyces sp. GS7 TaxID=2692234 RepID=UPI00191644E7|nr:hypothetical protein [Streptomyces sp. GS7]
MWHQEVVAPDHVEGYDGVVNDYFLVCTAHFAPRGVLSDDALAAEHISGLKWWRHRDIADHRGPDLFSPRELGTRLGALATSAIPAEPLSIGL